jgi:hypothetical protein
VRRGSRYTVRFPDAVEPTPELYRQRFAEFPFWYRWYLRLRALLGARTVEAATRDHHLQELRRRLDRLARGQVDCSVPALLTAFHQRVRTLQLQLRRIRMALEEATGLSRGAFLRQALERISPETAEALHAAEAIPEEDRINPDIPLEETQRRTRRRLEQTLDESFSEIEHLLGPVWAALRTLNLLDRIDLDALLPVQGARREQTPLRVVKEQLQELHQSLELCHTYLNHAATELAFEFARGRSRTKPGPPGAIWAEIEEFRAAVPLVDLVRYAAGEPFLEIPGLTIRSDWWGPFREEWILRGVEKTGQNLSRFRDDAVRDTLSRVYLIDRAPPAWIPTTLHPRTTGYLLLLAASEFFHDTRRVVTQLVIDAEFYHLDTRNALHQAALELDQALERLRTLLGDDRNRGTLGDEIQRIQHRSPASSLTRRRLTGLYERYRPRVRGGIETVLDALELIGSTIARTEAGTERAYLIHELHSQSFSGDYAPGELLEIVATHWYPLGRQLRGLYRLENDLGSRPVATPAAEEIAVPEME